MMKTAAKLTSV